LNVQVTTTICRKATSGPKDYPLQFLEEAINYEIIGDLKRFLKKYYIRRSVAANSHFLPQSMDTAIHAKHIGGQALEVPEGNSSVEALNCP
jgi:hypothetical protein